ncbi:hypothetical protein SDC9_145627 [bioreactor metagenome]|uniref:Uncharacterized protein n=1 Tax=bioreactor metagenome TaxID=1076179 RepID=A0A645EAK3_9ZZZZ
MRTFLPTGQHRRGIGLDGDDLDARLAGLQHFADTGHRAAGTDAGDEDIDLAVGVAPDFLRRRVAVDFRVGRVLELLRDEVFRIAVGQCPGLGDGAAHAFRTRRQNQFRPVGLEQQLALAAHRFGHGEGALDAARGADHGQADAGVAGSRFEYHGIRPDLAGGDGGVEHGDGDAILDTVAGIEEFQLGDDGGAAAGSNAIELDERRVADQFGDVVGDFHGGSPEGLMASSLELGLPYRKE